MLVGFFYFCDAEDLNDFSRRIENVYELKWAKLHIMLLRRSKLHIIKLLLLLMGYTSESATHSFSDWLCAQQTETGRKRWCHSLLPQNKKSHNKQEHAGLGQKVESCRDLFYSDATTVREYVCEGSESLIIVCHDKRTCATLLKTLWHWFRGLCQSCNTTSTEITQWLRSCAWDWKVVC